MASIQSKYNKVAGKKVVVIGGTSGIGYSAAEASLDLSANVFIGSSSSTKCSDAVSKMQALYPDRKIYGKAVDLKDEQSISDFFLFVDSVGERGIDHLIFTAGDALQLGPLDNLDIEKAKTAFDVRVFGVLRVVKHSKHLMNKGGSLIITTGTVAYKPSKGWSVASAMGGAVESMTRGLAVDLAPIRVNAVCPGFVDSPLWDGLSEEVKAKTFQAHVDKILVEAVGQPEDIAHGYIYLMSSAFCTGQVIVIDGGALIV